MGRSTPYGTVTGFVRSAQRGDYATAAQYLHTRKKGVAAQKLAQQLQAVLDWGLKVDLDKLSRKPEGNPSDNLEKLQDHVGTIDTHAGKLDVLLDRVNRNEREPVWLFSSETLALIPGAAEEISPLDFEKHLPKPLVHIRFLAIPIYRWILLIIALAISVVLSSLVTQAVFPLLRRVLRRVIGKGDKRALASIKSPIRLILMAGIILLFSNISVTLYMRQFCKSVGNTVAIIGLAWLLLRLIGILSALKERNLVERQMQGKIAMWALFGRLSKAAVIIISLLWLLHNAGANLTALLTGLGVGGIAIALGAQKTLENLFGGMVIISDEPIRVGDFCKIGNELGTVEDIGLRSTRIRTPSRTVIAIPNGQLATMSIENYSVRDKFWFRHVIGLRCETSADQLRYVLAEVRRMLMGHSKVEPRDARMRFVGFNASSLDCEIFAYVITETMTEFLSIQEDLLLKVMDIVSESGASIAFPSRTTYVAKDEPGDAQKTAEAVMRAREWREKNSLPDHGFYTE